MYIYITIISIILIITILFILIKDRIKFLHLLAVASLSVGVSLALIGVILRILFNTYLRNFNITKITSIIFSKFIYISIPLVIIGIIGIIASNILKKEVKIHN